MIYLIGGPPRCGKTTLTEKLAKKTSFPYFTLDHVTSVISPYVPENEYVNKLPLQVARRETNFSNDAFYAKYSSDQAVDLYTHQAETYWPGIQSFIKYAIEDEHDLILEGWQILPHLLKTAITPENQKHLKIIFLYKTNIENIISGLKANTADKDWVLRHTKEEKTFLSIAKMISCFSSHIEMETKKYSFHAVNTDFEFKQKIDDSTESLCENR